MYATRCSSSLIYGRITVAANSETKTIPLFLLLIITLSLLLSGCAGNIIALSYPSAQHAPPAISRGISVCIVDFADKRPDSAIGKRQNGEKLLPRTPVERWLATGLALELQRAGFNTMMAETVHEALAMNADYIVTGDSEEVCLTETSITRYTGIIRASISLLDGRGTHITRNAYNSVYSKTVLPIYGVPQTLLDDALAEMLQPAVALLIKTMQ